MEVKGEEKRKEKAVWAQRGRIFSRWSYGRMELGGKLPFQHEERGQR
jgi:hypothetical protein